jgi:hypothetical protein
MLPSLAATNCDESKEVQMALSKEVTTTKRRFVYSAHPDVIKHFLIDSGYATQDVVSGDKVIGFDVAGTTVRVDFDIVLNDQIVADGMVSVTNNAFTLGGDHEKAERSLRLYQTLYNRFRERK